jgi:outer membrane protein assembly factor BamA
VLDRYYDYVNALSSLGGDSRLRGYPSGAFVGRDFFAANFEYRSRPFEILSVDFAGVAFFDTGDAFDDFAKIRLKHAVGVGARVEFPQLERTVLRVDWGFPLTQGPGLPKPFPGDVVISFGQAFGVPVIPTGN